MPLPENQKETWFLARWDGLPPPPEEYKRLGFPAWRDGGVKGSRQADSTGRHGVVRDRGGDDEE